MTCRSLAQSAFSIAVTCGQPNRIVVPCPADN
jgi:hypothetical protein